MMVLPFPLEEMPFLVFEKGGSWIEVVAEGTPAGRAVTRKGLTFCKKNIIIQPLLVSLTAFSQALPGNVAV